MRLDHPQASRPGFAARSASHSGMPNDPANRLEELFESRLQRVPGFKARADTIAAVFGVQTWGQFGTLTREEFKEKCDIFPRKRWGHPEDSKNDALFGVGHFNQLEDLYKEAQKHVEIMRRTQAYELTHQSGLSGGSDAPSQQ